MFGKIFNKDKREARKKAYNESVYKYWGPISDKGLIPYALKHATYGWALPVFAIYSILMYVMGKISRNSAYSYDKVQFILSMTVFIIFGFFYGVITFKKNEKIYRAKYPYKSKRKK